MFLRQIFVPGLDGRKDILMTILYVGYAEGIQVMGELRNLHPNTSDEEIYQILGELGIVGVTITARY